MSLSVIPLTILGQITGVSGSGETALYQVSFKSIDGTPLYGVTAVWTDEQAEIEALAAQKPYGVWINPIDGTFTVKFAGYTYVGSADLTDSDVLAGITPIEFANQSGGGSLPSSIFDITQTLDFSNLETTATVAETSFTKTSNVALTAEQLNGAIFKMGENELVVTSDMLSDMSALGVTGTLITLPSPYGSVLFSCTEAGSVVSEPGCYLATQMMLYVNSVILSYQETYEATVKAVATGTAELTDNASSLPDGVIYLQIEG